MMEQSYSLYTNDVFTPEVVTPSAGIANMLLLFDNFNGNDPLQPLTEDSRKKLWQTTYFLPLIGSAEFIINGELITVKAGELLATMPDSILHFKQVSEDIRYILIVVYPRIFQKTLEDLGVDYNLVNLNQRYMHKPCTQVQQRHLLNIYETLKRDIQRGEYEYRNLYVRAYLNSLVANEMSIFGTEMLSMGNSGSRQYDIYRKFFVMLNQYSSQQRSVAFYADKLGITPKYLSFITLQYSNKNASLWIDEYVVAKAKTILRTDGYDLQKICTVLNFASTNSFIRFFKRVEKITPKEFWKTSPKM